jgi:hypothetical protein
MHIPEDALLQYEYMTPIGECLFPRSSPTDQPRGLMPACRWLPAPALKLRHGRSPWRPRFPRPGQVRSIFHLTLLSQLHGARGHPHPRQYQSQFSLQTASTLVNDRQLIIVSCSTVPQSWCSCIKDQCHYQFISTPSSLTSAHKCGCVSRLQQYVCLLKHVNWLIHLLYSPSLCLRTIPLNS